MDIAKLLHLLSDNEKFSHSGDSLGQVINETLRKFQLESNKSNDELDDDTLEQLSAAGNPHYIATGKSSKTSR